MQTARYHATIVITGPQITAHQYQRGFVIVMTDRFDPNIPPRVPFDPTDPTIQGSFLGCVAVTEQPVIGKANLVINGDQSFKIHVKWHVFGNLVPLWLGALAQATRDWVVTAYAESEGPGPEKMLGTMKVPVGGPNFGEDEVYEATLGVAAHTLAEENPGNPAVSGVYRLAVTVFLNSTIGPFDMIGYADGPIVKVESPQ